MKINFESKKLRLLHPFILSDSRIESKDVIIIYIEHEGITGIGESSPSRYYGEPPESVLSCLSKAGILLSGFKDPFEIENIMQTLLQHFPNNSSARSGIDIALYDWIGKKLQLPLHQFFGLDKIKTPVTSFTIGIDELKVIEKKIHEAESYPILKIKLGVGERDFEIIKTIRNVTDKILRVDVNEGWNKDEAARKIEWLAGQGVELVEQPLPKESLEEMIWLKQRSALPLFADENVKTGADIPELKECFHGVNIKLDKCGGLFEARRMVNSSRTHGLKVMLGCMIQTVVGISAASQISPSVDFADLDGHLLIDDKSFHGMEIKNGKIILNNQPGIGIFEQDV